MTPQQQDRKPLVNRYQELLAELDAQSETGDCGMAGRSCPQVADAAGPAAKR